MLKKILIANRGEIACRVIKTARRMGIETVAVYSDADADALHVRLADEAVRIGPAAASESYLVAEKIVETCKHVGADAVHPGYGFLSERASFAKLLDEAGITFIGPPPNAIAAMGDKIESKKLAREAGVNVVPGFVGEIEDTDHAVKIANDIGYPVMMKASAGGGGKGMRLAWSEKDVREGFPSVRSEGLNSFGDDRVFIEKFVEQPRHIEIQVLADKHGNCVYLGERECSIQRRHQKVVEEAPSPFVTPEMRKAMGEQAVELSKAVGYTSAGTVEFIAGADRSFYFLEMNTRLQVEHPVTEFVTGLDLVEQMIRVAAGEKLAFGQDDVTLTGWAMESRVYAEDPYRSFLPSIGRLTAYQPPEEVENAVRVDTGVLPGSEISMFYDPMIAKLITYGETREQAIDRNLEALNHYVIRGISHNIDFLAALMRHDRFRSGEITTNFIAEEYPDGFEGAPLSDLQRRQVIAAAAVIQATDTARTSELTGQLNGKPAFGSDWVVVLDGEGVPVSIDGSAPDWDLEFGGSTMEVESGYMPGDLLFTGKLDGEPFALEVQRLDVGYRFGIGGSRHDVRTLTPRTWELSSHMIEKEPPDLSKMLLCPMPGLVMTIHVTEGDKVEAGQPLAVVEAMKMENILRAEKSATVSAIKCEEGDSLAVDDVIMEFE
ncbi:acetyl/propionyl-CoA carboxylase subunit alpha [Pacificimonas flava]|uniref:propionyl-CoA carboxylase n=2 Tax=Pacificimonas TaxID=1960290 RepID=A0A219B8A3_9SPHN|nr:MULTISPECIES: acetyl/propionyl/methylcrotonyl-CoA carboxylase subunit alpha [Pacificimonas]MBZ6377787.1 acetyl/propionyl/methylcrotonyl-CoA carboxylase subunit alpha [Pacificimonas aurantium]OWV34612.1 acetyl/propionyl-CoA carboxylase subunit alpha [Pacificimonas flava]